MRIALSVLAGVVVGLASGCGSSSHRATHSTVSSTGLPASTKSGTYVLKARLSTKQEASPPKGTAAASGAFTATLRITGKTTNLVWKMSLSGLTSVAQSAAVYVRAPGKTQQIAFSLCRPCSTSGNGSYSGPPAATSTLLGAALAGEAYVNVATKKNPAGEIRGQVGIVAKK
jgi:hypothetical protein